MASLTPRRPLTQTGKGYLIAVVGVAVWSATATIIGFINKRYALPPFVIAAWRDGFTCLIMLAALFLIKRSLLRFPRKESGFIILYGVLLSVFNSIWTISVALNGAAVSTVMVYSSAAFTAVIAWPLFGEKLTPVRLVAILFSLAGCALVAGAFDSSAWRSNFLGVITGLASGLGFSAYSLMGKEAARRGISSWTALMYTFGLAAILLSVYNFILPRIGSTILGSPSLVPNIDSAGWLVLFLLALGPTLGGYGLYNLSLNYLPATISNLIATLEPSLTAIQSYFLLGERFSTPQVAGSLLIISGVVILRLLERRIEGQPMPVPATNGFPPTE